MARDLVPTGYDELVREHKDRIRESPVCDGTIGLGNTAAASHSRASPTPLCCCLAAVGADWIGMDLTAWVVWCYSRLVGRPTPVVPRQAGSLVVSLPLLAAVAGDLEGAARRVAPVCAYSAPIALSAAASGSP
jgi:hypothetical protein